MKACLGIDTSCYMTSAALWGVGDNPFAERGGPGPAPWEEGAADGLFFQARKPLPVKPGARGLAQSEAVFQHARSLPELLEALFQARRDMPVAAVCASGRPRPVKGSYMPVFRVGQGIARSIAAALGVPCYETTHQEGHLAAARVGSGLGPGDAFLALHLSGGTTEVLLASGDTLALLGGTEDLHAGQLIDRVGVALGLPFPAGPSLERLAEAGAAQGRLPAAVRGLACHFSGAEAQALRWREAQALSPADIAAEVFDCVARTVARLAATGCREAGTNDALLFGGVASSAMLRREIIRRVARQAPGLRLRFARPELSGDNAVGVARVGAERLGRGRYLEL